MPHRAHLLSLRLAHALRESLREPPYNAARLGKDCLAGMTVGLVAIPLAMALAIASGVPPQYGLYSAMIAGLLIPLTGGSRYSVSGPTAAFVVILFPIVQQYGFAGLLLATMLSGALLVLMAVLRLGRYIEYIPQSVTLGFTCGIAIVIAVLQLPEFLNFSHQDLPPHFAEKALVIAQRITQFHTPSLLVGLATLAVLLLWPRLQSPIPPQLPALLVGLALGWLLTGLGSQIATIGNSFHYLGADGNLANGIPGHLPDFQWPWNRHLPNDPQLAFSWQGAQDLLGAAFAIAMLGAIESLLCAVVLDGMSGIKHSANSELLGQGIGNIITPLFGGITATAAIARSAANLKAGAQTPIAAAIHALVVLLAVLTLAPLLSYLPMASMAALLLVVAWNMSEAHKAVHLVKTSPPSDVLVFATCLSLTVLFDMVIAISAGVLLASVLFVKQMAEMTRLADVSANPKYVPQELAPGWKAFRINGPLFFAAADRIFGELGTLLADRRGIILSMEGVTVLDAGGLAAMQKFIAHCGKAGVKLFLTDFEFQPLKALARSGFKPDDVSTFTFPSLEDALRHPLLSGFPEGVSDGPVAGAATLQAGIPDPHTR